MALSRKAGFTLIEILTVTVIMAVLAAMVLPLLSGSTQDAKGKTALFNLQTLRSQIEIYKSQHDGEPPATLEKLTVATNAAGDDPAGDETAFGPYLHDVPANPLVDPTFARVAKAPAANPPTAIAASAGWLYDPTTGEVWLNHADYLTH